MKIIILILGRIGDMILAIPGFRLIKEQYPDARITVIASRYNIEIARQSPHVNEVILWNNSPFKLVKAVAKLLTTRYEYYIDPKDHHSSNSQMIARLVRAKKKIYYKGKSSDSVEGNVSSLKQNDLAYYTDVFILAMTPIGVSYPGFSPKPELIVSPDSEKFAEDFFEQKGINDFVFVNISAGKDGKDTLRNWPIEKWKQLIRHILHTEDCWIVLNVMGEMREQAAAYFKEEPRVIIIPTRNIMDLISFVKRSSIVITPDTSVVHISAAFDKPLVTLHYLSEKNTKRFYPVNSKKVVVIPRGGQIPVDAIEIDQVIGAYETLRAMVKS